MDVFEKEPSSEVIMNYLDEQGINARQDGYRLLVSLIQRSCGSKESVSVILQKVSEEYGLTMDQLKGRVRYALAHADNKSLAADPGINKFILRSSIRLKGKKI